MRQGLISFDKKVYQFERAIVGYIFLAISAVVFVDVLHRVFSRSPGRLSTIIGGWIESTPETLEKFVSPALIALTVFVAAYFAIKNNHKMRGIVLSKGKLLLKTFLATIITIAAVQTFLYFDAEGIVWAPYFGLIGLLWLGFIGASMATHTNQHLLLEMGEKIWPEKMLPSIRMIAHILVAVFVIVIAYLGCLSAMDHFSDWQSGPGAGLVPSIGWPKWMIYLVIPYAFFMMGFRFLGIGLGIFKPVKIAEF